MTTAPTQRTSPPETKARTNGAQSVRERAATAAHTAVHKVRDFADQPRVTETLQRIKAVPSRQPALGLAMMAAVIISCIQLLRRRKAARRRPAARIKRTAGRLRRS